MSKNVSWDKAIILIVILVGCVLMGCYFLLPKKSGESIQITVDGCIYGEYDLDKEQEIPVIVGGKETNTVVIKEHKAYMKQASCPDHLCKKQGEIDKDKESIVCLPNKVVVMVVSQENGEYDSVAK